MKLILATGNKNKIREIEAKFQESLNITCIPLHTLSSVPEIIEDGQSFEENAVKKAKIIADYYNLPVMADDSGLVVDALGGKPGIYSARYGGEKASSEEKNSLLLEELKGVTEAKRTAHFICAIAICMPNGDTYTTQGELYGKISKTPRGSKGFGYDPVFYLPEKGTTLAELTLEEKNRISHRALALESACLILKKIINKQ